MTRPQILRTAVISVIILAIVVALDFLVNGVLFPGVAPYTPWVTIGITLFVAPPFVGYLIIQQAKVQRATMALQEERVARHAADAASAAKTQFIANMSHELRTPLNAIIGYAEIIEEDGAGAVVADSQRIQRSAKHLLGLISEILDHAKLEAGELRTTIKHVPLEPVFDEVVEAIRPLAAANGNRFDAVCEPGIGAACLDDMRLKQCMLNVANNAAKFTKDGKVSLRLRAAGADAVEFEVADTGIGMSEETISRLFQPFVQADLSVTREYGGTGLGLAITKQLMDTMGGEVAVRSAPGAGSTFTLRFKRGAGNVAALAA